MSAKIYNITDKLNSEKPKIVIGEKEYEVDNGLMATAKSLDVMSGDFKVPDSIDSVIEIHLGKKAVNDIREIGLSFADYQVVFYAVVAAAQGVEYDEIAQRFQK